MANLSDIVSGDVEPVYVIETDSNSDILAGIVYVTETSLFPIVYADPLIFASGL